MGVGITLFIMRAQTAIIATSPFIGIITCAGGVLAGVSVILMAQPYSDWGCQTWLWLTAFAYTLMFGALFVRTWRSACFALRLIFHGRNIASGIILFSFTCLVFGFLSDRIDTIFNSVNLRAVKIPDHMLLLRIGALLLVDIIVLIWWQIKSPMKPMGFVVPTTLDL
jgi:uncharacterized membrane protein HdeD (DUF308 family)